MPAFRAESPQGLSLCFGGSSPVDNSSACSVPCDQSWENDNIWVHQPNCGMLVYFYDVLIAEMSLLSFVMGYLLCQRLFKEKKTTARHLVIVHLSAVGLVWLLILALYLQRGFFEFAAVVNIVLTIVVQYEIFLHQRTVLLAPIMAVERIPDIVKRSMLAQLQRGAIMFTTLFTVVNLGMAVTCQGGHDEMYNNFVLAHMLVMPAGCTFMLLFGPPMERRLLKHINDAISAAPVHSDSSSANSANVNKLAEFKERLVRSFSQGKRSVFFTGGAALPGAIVFLCLGSFPFQWVVMALVYHGVTLFGSLGLLKLLDKPVADGGLKATSSAAAAVSTVAA